jgi:hypothetical protein
MPVTPDQPAPYAPASAIVELVERHRNKGLPTPVDADVLARAGISSSLIPRTLQALQTLDLIDSEGKPSQILEGIRLAAEADYVPRLGEWLAHAYGDALQFVDPANDDETRIRDAFRNYKPVGQQSRMVTLFIGLFKAAGIAPVKAQTGAGRKVSVVTRRMAPRQPPPPKADVGRPGKPLAANFDGALPPAIAGLLASLPTNGEGWTKAERDAFMTTLGVVVDFCFPPGVVAPRAITAEGDDASAA